ncbi:MAG: hypothetical protein PUP46_05800 [Endozoicomonas sp. (ex Botrylloides leachii)]|nr:hypothetical protein [Endozoicomonas sp. (ex Botrylloides leachii)]
MYFERHDRYNIEITEFGYGDIDFPIFFQNKGISYIYHYIEALTALEIGSVYFAVDSVVSHHLRHALHRSGMENKFSLNSFHGYPVMIQAKAKECFIAKNWMLDSSS